MSNTVYISDLRYGVRWHCSLVQTNEQYTHTVFNLQQFQQSILTAPKKRRNATALKIKQNVHSAPLYNAFFYSIGSIKDMRHYSSIMPHINQIGMLDFIYSFIYS
jgi:hypothetical protein